MTVYPFDDQRMRQALALAQSAIGLSDPNPRVGCVIGDEKGTVFGTGHTQVAGGPHAEVMALAAARDHGAPLRGATVWVSLEPCAHHGRTPPCCEALIAAQVARVVVAVGDPFPEVSGRGIEALRRAGVQVDLAGPEHAAAARELNIGFFSRIERQRPWVRLKVAASLDGRTSLPDGSSQWITGPEARLDTHAWRKRASAVVTGIGTVLADDPRMDVRLVETARQPLRLVLDSGLRIPLAARVIQAPGPACVAYDPSRHPGSDKIAALRDMGVDALALAGGDPVERARQLVGWLNDHQANEVHLEAGATLNGSFLRANVVDELLVYLAPALMVGGPPIAALDTPARMADVRRYQLHGAEQFGTDLRLRLLTPECPSWCVSGNPQK